ncbi:ribonuclease E/G [Candidatus Puniceispirillum marinum]|uniref:Ribonuclease, Rne/Rng family n=1 Tax=Puniceispirillum marinum (strain IMCC1322) TaxID=488538 RepID=D5BTG0_PUNMI|nr:ribonuclease E/G [Candidatus Puniceispirillum marinum]ADE39557.1 ribonuclease, Rne/Rng family [Candidatus Puniceispirillum marinum IMCC1322]
MTGLVTHIYVDEAPGQTRVAFICGKPKGVLDDYAVTPDSIYEIWHRRWDVPTFLGTVHLARVEQVFTTQNRATARLYDDTSVSVRLRAKDRLKPGDVRPITITAAPREDKAWQAVLGARLVSRYGILLPGSSGVFRSKRFSSSDFGDAIESMIKAVLPHDFGFIIRGAASALSLDAMEDAVKTLLHAWQMGAQLTSDQIDVARSPRVIHDAGTLAEQIARYAPDAELIKLPDPAASQHLAATLDEVIDNALQARVPLPQGGCLWCQRTHALWAIDLDSAGYNNPKAGDMLQSLAMVAIPEMTRQIRLRAMGGALCIDLPRLGSKAGKAFLTRFADACADDSRAPEILGFTRGGLLEMRVPYGEQSLADIMADRIAQTALAGLRLASHRIASSPVPAVVELAVSAPVSKWLAEQGAPACTALDRPLRPVVLSDLAPDAPAYILN